MKRLVSSLVAVLLIGVIAYMLFVPTNGVAQISTSELEQMLEKTSSQAVFIDVREPHEYEAGHIEGFPNYPLSSFGETFHELPKDKEIVIICRSGNRSMQAAKILKQEGYMHVTNVKGGMIDWQGEVVSRLKKY